MGNFSPADDSRLQSAEGLRRQFENERFFLLSPDLLAVMAPGGILLRISPSWERLLGYRSDELVGHSTDELLHPEDLERVRATRSEVLSGTTLVDYATRVRHKDGTYRAILWSSVRDGNENIYYAIGHDFTARRHADELMRASEERYRVLFYNSPVPNWLYDVHTRRFIDVNEAAIKQYGYSREEFLSLTVNDIRAPDQNEALERAIQQGREGRTAFGVWTHRRKDGSTVDVEITAHTVLLDGRSTRLVIAYDVSSRRRHEEVLLERATLASLTAGVGIALNKGSTLREMLQMCTDAIVSGINFSYVRIWTHDAEKGLFELQASSGEGWDNRLDGDYSSVPVERANLLSAMLKSRKPRWTNELGTDPELGDHNWAMKAGFTAFAGLPLIIEDEVVGVLAAFGKKPIGSNALRALQAVGDAISLGVRRKLVEKAKTELEAQLRQSQRMESIGSLAGGIAHDFNNLLSVIISYAAMLENDAPEPMREDLDQIRKAGERAAELTRQLLAFSRRQILQPRLVDLNEIVAGMEKMLRRLIGENIDFVTFPAAEPATVNVDPAQMEQVLVNLAVNARDAMPKGGKLTIELQQVELDQAYASHHAGVTPGRYILLAVSDTGIGMDEATKVRIFEPFFTTKEVGKGTGLGLSTVFGIVRQSGGHVYVYSEKGRGSSFKVYLPASRETPTSLQPVSEQPADLRGTGTVLLVEDEEPVRKLARTILTRAGYTVLEAQTGGDALLTAEQRELHIDLLLTDIVMPRMSGANLSARLSSLRPGLRVLFMSGYTDTMAGEQGVPQGAFFVQKPFTPEALLKKVRQAMTEQPPQAKPAPRAKVLVVDDQVVMLRLLSRALSQYELAQFSDPLKALEQVNAGQRFDAVVCDLYMPGLSGVRFQDELAKIDPSQARRMLFLTGAILGSEMGEFVKRNLGRILNKPVDIEALRSAVAKVLHGD